MAVWSLLPFAVNTSLKFSIVKTEPYMKDSADSDQTPPAFI